jgi:hypothetical protein
MARIPLVLGGLAAAAGGVAAYVKRRTGESPATPPPAPLPAPTEAEPGQTASTAAPAPAPAISNFDAAGPPENTATHVPAPEPLIHEPAGGIDEAAEEAAAAAEAANIGGGVPDYPGTELGELADEEERPLIEAGEGEAEGQEVAEFELRDNAEPAAGDPLEGGRQIDDVIEAQDHPDAGERPFDDQSSHGSPRAEAEQSAVGTTTPLEDPPVGSDPTAPGAMGGSSEGAAPTPPNPGATTTDASAAQFDAAAPPAPDARVEGLPEPPAPSTPTSSDDPLLAPTTVEDGAPTAGGSLSGAAEEHPPAEQPEAGEEDDGGEWQTWSGRAGDS